MATSSFFPYFQQVTSLCYFQLIFLGLTMFYTPDTMSAKLRPIISGNNLAIKIEKINYPDKILNQELKSGLPNNIEIIITIDVSSKLLLTASALMSVTYDLWDEHFLLDRTDNTGYSRNTVKDIKTLIQELSNITVFNLANLSDMDPNVEYRLNARVIFNPVQRDRIEKIKAWIGNVPRYNRTNRGNTKINNVSNPEPSNPSKSNNSYSTTIISSSGPRFKKLFDKILEQYASSDEPVAQWQSGVITKIFSIKRLPNE